MHVCFYVHVYEKYFSVSMHMLVVSVYIQLMCAYSVYTFLHNMCVYALYVACMYNVSIYACGCSVYLCCMVYECLMCMHVCI